MSTQRGRQNSYYKSLVVAYSNRFFISKICLPCLRDEGLENRLRGIGAVYAPISGKNLSVVYTSFLLMLIALSGTPGVGKTAVAEVLAAEGWQTVELNNFAAEEGLLGRRDEERDTVEVDVEALDDAVSEREWAHRTVFVGHLSHLLSVDLTIVLRCSPKTLETRLKERDWSQEKIWENVEAEVCDVILVEALETVEKVYEIDTTKRPPEQVASAVQDIVKGKTKRYMPGNVEWSEEVLEWY